MVKRAQQSEHSPFKAQFSRSARDNVRELPLSFRELIMYATCFPPKGRFSLFRLITKRYRKGLLLNESSIAGGRLFQITLHIGPERRFIVRADNCAAFIAVAKSAKFKGRMLANDEQIG